MEVEGTWRWRVWSAARALAAHALLLTFTILLFLKLRHVFSCSWWLVFSPLWLFHGVVARGRISIPSPSDRDECLWVPFHAGVATTLLVAFELLICVYLESTYVNKVAAVNLKIVFVPVLILETSIVIDNLRVTFWTSVLEAKEKINIQEITPDRRRGEDVQCEIMLNMMAILSMACILGATVSMVQYSAGDDQANEVKAWAIFTLFRIGLFIGYLVCICDLEAFSSPWRKRDCRSLSRETRYSDPSSPPDWSKIISLRSLGGHLTMVLLYRFMVLVYVHLKGTPPSTSESLSTDLLLFTPVRAGETPLGHVFSPLFLLQGIGVVFYTAQLVERIVPIDKDNNRRRYYSTFVARAGEFLEFVCHGSRFLAWWSIDQGIAEMQARRLHDDLNSGCNTFFGTHPDLVKKMSKKDLVEEVRTLQAALNEQLNKSSQQDDQRERILCKICFQREIDVLLLPCRHRILCSTCGAKCSKCPICRVFIAKRNKWASKVL